MGSNNSKNIDFLVEAWILIGLVDDSLAILPILGKRKRSANEIRDRGK